MSEIELSALFIFATLVGGFLLLTMEERRCPVFFLYLLIYIGSFFGSFFLPLDETPLAEDVSEPLYLALIAAACATIGIGLFAEMIRQGNIESRRRELREAEEKRQAILAAERAAAIQANAERRKREQARMEEEARREAAHRAARKPVIAQAEAEGKDVCWTCLTIAPPRCVECEVCLVCRDSYGDRCLEHGYDDDDSSSDDWYTEPNDWSSG